MQANMQSPIERKIQRVRFYLLITIGIIGTFFWSCASRKDTLHKRLAENPIRSIQYWGEHWKVRPLSKRIEPAPKELVDYLRMENELYNFPEKPVSVPPTPEFFKAFKAIESQLPKPVKQLVKERLIGIFIVNDLGSSGFAEAIADRDGEEKFAIIVLDRDVLLKRKANEWATWKENSIFRSKEADGVTLNMVIETEENNTVVNAIRYILLHELGHVLGLISKAHPSWLPSKAPIKDIYPFARISWKLTERSKFVSRFEEGFPERKLVQYYTFEKAPLSSDQIVDIYDKFQKNTNLVSMQAVTSMWEDFAESFTIYVHVIREKRPWQIRINPKNRPPMIIESCWVTNRCNDKKAFMEKWFKNPLEKRPP